MFIIVLMTHGNTFPKHLMRGFQLYFLGGTLQVFASSVFHFDNSFKFTLLHLLLL